MGSNALTGELALPVGDALPGEDTAAYLRRTARPTGRQTISATAAAAAYRNAPGPAPGRTSRSGNAGPTAATSHSATERADLSGRPLDAPAHVTAPAASKVGAGPPAYRDARLAPLTADQPRKEHRHR